MRTVVWSDPPTFRARLMAWAALLSIGILMATSLVVYLGARSALRANLDEALLSMARTQIGAALHGPGGEINLPRKPPASLRLPAGSGYEEFAQIEDASGRVVARTANLNQDLALRPNRRLMAEAHKGTLSFGDTRLGGAAYRAIYYPLRDPEGNRLVAMLAVSREPMQRTLRSLLGVIVAALIVAGTGAAWASGRLARSLTRPLGRIAAATLSVGEDNLDARIPLVSPDEELRRVTDLLNAMLERLQLAFEQRRQFLADASHELRTPLSNVRGTVEVALRRDRTAEEYRETLSVTLNEVDRLSRLVADLLTLSRADAGRLALTSVPTSLSAIARHAAETFSSRADGAGVVIEVRSDEDVQVMADPDGLRQVVDNLLDNALRYAPQGSAVEVRVGRDACHATLAVRDHGAGIPLEIQQHVFERFFRADPARARRSGGTGLGLAIARAIVAAHGGELGVRSTPGAGAEFRLRLPTAPTRETGAERSQTTA